MTARRVALALCALLGLGCVRMPSRVTPVEPFDAQRYLGRWYEIARLPHSFERGLVNVTAERDILKSYDLGASAYIEKPVTFGKLVETVQALGRYWFEIVKPPPRE